MYTKHDLTQTNKIEEVNITSDKYHATLDRLLNQVAMFVIHNGNPKDVIKYYMKRYYYSHQNIENDTYPIDHLYEEWDHNRKTLR